MGVLRRAAPVPNAANAGRRPFLKRRQSVAPPSAESFVPNYTKVTRNGVVVEMEVIPVGGEVSVGPSRGVVARESSARRAGGGADQELSVPRPPNRTKVEMEVIPVGGEMSVDPTLGPLRKRLASELDALRDLVKKAELLSRGGDKSGKDGQFLAAEPRPEATMEAGGETPPAKRRKTMSPSVEQTTEAKKEPGKLAEEIKINASVPEEDEFVDICGGCISPVAILDAAHLISPEKASDGSHSPSSSSDSGSSSASDTDSDASSSSSGSDSESESDSDESVISTPAAELVVSPGMKQSAEKQPEAQRAAPAARPVTMAQATALKKRREEEKERAREREREEARAREQARAMLRRELLAMERAALPDETIRPRDMARLGIAAFQYVVSTERSRADRRRPSKLQQLGIFLKPDDGSGEERRRRTQVGVARHAEEREEGEIV